MNILILGINGDIANAIINKIYKKNNNYYCTFSKKKPNFEKKNIIAVKINFKTLKGQSKKINFLKSKNIDLIINNVGDSNPYKKFEYLSDNEFNDSLKINFLSPLKIISTILKQNLKKKKKLDIINISSNTVKFYGSKKNFPYFISKLALDYSLQYLSKHFSKNKIRINIIRPGLIKTNKSTKLIGYSLKEFKKREKLIPANKSGSPSDISNLVDFLMDKKSNFISGQIISVSGGE